MRTLILFLLPVAAFATNPPAAPTQSQSAYQAQTQNQHQSQNSTATAGDAASSNVLSIQDRLQIPYTPPPTAPAIYASNPCAVGSSKALTLPVFGTSSGKTTIDSECQFRELVRVTLAVDPCLARKLLATHPAIAAIAPEPVVCAPPADLVELEKRITDKIGTAFKQSQSK